MNNIIFFRNILHDFIQEIIISYSPLFPIVIDVSVAKDYKYSEFSADS